MIYKAACIAILSILLAACSARTRTIPGIEKQSIPQAEITIGEGSPAVIFESSVGDGHEIWQLVISKLSSKTKLYAYSRNFGTSTTNVTTGFANIKTSSNIAEALRTRLQSRSISPPYILVGHAYGGLYVLKYAELFPNDVAGIVLVDSRPAGFSQTCTRLKFANCEIPFFIRSLQTPNAQREIRGLSQSEIDATPASKLGDIPVTVITSTVPNKEQTLAYQQQWIREQENYAHSLKNGRLVTALGTGHYIQTQRPNLIAEEIIKLLPKTQ